MHNIKLIALDLDGTLLNTRKELSRENAAALERAAAQGIEIVPTTGRFFGGMPEVIQKLPYIHYAITINGAQVYDIRRNRAIGSTEIPLGQAIEIMEYLDGFPVIYDCFMDNWGWMTGALKDKAQEYAPDAYYLKMIRELRTSVDDLKTYLREKERDVQKIQLFARNMKDRKFLLETLEQSFENIVVSSSVVNNIEINHKNANKGTALRCLAEHLGFTMQNTMAFGDGLNDVSMIREAGVGIAMQNAEQIVKQYADYITEDCDHHGVAAGIARFCF